jgi:hypothetical protein
VLPAEVVLLTNAEEAILTISGTRGAAAEAAAAEAAAPEAVAGGGEAAAATEE